MVNDSSAFESLKATVDQNEVDKLQFCSVTSCHIMYIKAFLSVICCFILFLLCITSNPYPVSIHSLEDKVLLCLSLTDAD